MLKKLVLVSLSLLSLTHSSETDVNKQWSHKYEKGAHGANIEKAWPLVRPKRRITVAVIDSGIDYEHPDLAGNIWKNSAEIPDNGIDDDKNGYTDDYHGISFIRSDNNPVDEAGHGTHVAGIIGAEHNDIGVSGVMGSVKIMPIQFNYLCWPNTADCWKETAKGIDYAVDMGAAIINMSLGSELYSEAMYEAIKRANEKGVIIVAAAMNYSEQEPYYPAAYNLPNVISVASSNIHGLPSDFTNFGKKHVHLFAPGEDIISTLPHSSYGLKSGTSMSAPLVTGIIGLYLANGGSPKDVKQRLIDTARRYEQFGGLVFSNGLINAPAFIKGQTSLNFMWND